MVTRSLLVKTSLATIFIVAAANAARAVDTRSVVRWGTRYGLPRLAIAAGSADRRPVRTAVRRFRVAKRSVPFLRRAACYRRGGTGKIAAVTARHDACTELVRSPHFLAGYPNEALPRPIQAAMAWAQDSAVSAVLSILDRPYMLVSNGPEHARFRRLVTARHPPGHGRDQRAEDRAVAKSRRRSRCRAPWTMSSSG